LTDNVEVYADVLHNKTSSAFQLAPDPFTTQGGVVISADSYYNPFGIEYRAAEAILAPVSSLLAIAAQRTARIPIRSRPVSKGRSASGTTSSGTGTWAWIMATSA